MAAEAATAEENEQERLLEAVLRHVPFDGWNRSALARAASDLGCDPGLAALVFPGGGIDALIAFLDRSDRRMMAALAAHDLERLRIRERIITAIWLRLEELAPHREAVRRAVALLALPQNAGLSARRLWRTADLMWQAAGDRATDHNYYTKRLILAGVYSSTLLVWIGDETPGQVATRAFLERRIDNVMQFEKAKAAWRRSTGNLPSLGRFLGRLRYPVR